MLLYIMVRIWCDWRKVAISSTDGGLVEYKKEEGRWIYSDKKTRNGEYWNMNTLGFSTPSPNKQSPDQSTA